MESKLKALKVVDLKAILQQANVALAGKANKADLIAKILASPQAVLVFTSANAAPATQNTPVATAVPPGTTVVHDTRHVPDTPTPSDTLQSTTTPVDTPAEHPAPVESASDPDDTEAKRKARAARFGIPYEVPQPASPPTTKNAQGKTTAIAIVPDDPEKVKIRSQKFSTPIGAPTAPALSTAGRNKRQQIASDPVDAEEEERRRKRIMRFGLDGPASVEAEEMRKQRAERFGSK